MKLAKPKFQWPKNHAIVSLHTNVSVMKSAVNTQASQVGAASSTGAQVRLRRSHRSYDASGEDPHLPRYASELWRAVRVIS